MRILADFHHHALAESYGLTFEDRLGYEVWFPYSMDWWDAEVWQFEKLAHGDAVARQYLLGVWGAGVSHITADGTIHLQDPRHPDRILKGITLEAARSQPWDLVLSSLPNNDVGYHRLAGEVGAKFGVQVGNVLQYSRWDLADLIIAATTMDRFGPEYVGKRFEYGGAPAVMVHQEIDTERIWYHDWPPAHRREVASFVVGFDQMEQHYPEFVGLASSTRSEFDWVAYGAYGEQWPAGPTISPVPEIADAMRAARIGWHTKRADGFGHVIHDWAAIGRPVVGWERYYKGGLGSLLWLDGVTSFDVGRRSDDEVLAILRRLRDDDDYHHAVSLAAADRFRQVVDYQAEAEAIRGLLEDVL